VKIQPTYWGALTDFIFRSSYILQNQILCDLHFADVALMECSDFMQQLRSFKPQSLGCAVARRKSSTTLIFPLPPQACSGMYQIQILYALCVLCVPCGPYPKCTAGDGHISRVLWPNRYWERIGGIALSPADTPGILLAEHINIPIIFRQ